MLYTVAYPSVASSDAAFIEQFRRMHDLPYRDVVAAHFTLVFGCKALPETEYVTHVQTIADSATPVHFSCRYAMLGAHHQDDTAYVFLVPDEGYSAISLLHDRLYTGALQPYLKRGVPFIPHITIGAMKDWNVAKALCDDVNRKGVRIDGSLQSVTVGALENGRLRELSSHRLGTWRKSDLDPHQAETSSA
jgi:2'-5' RNA ligase